MADLDELLHIDGRIPLDADQVRAITHTGGHALILAGAGSGKTEVLTRRFAWLLREGIPEQQVVAVTFTQEATREMRQRVQGWTGTEPTHVRTCHSLALHLTESSGTRRVLDDHELGRMIRATIEEERSFSRNYDKDYQFCLERVPVGEDNAPGRVIQDALQFVHHWRSNHDELSSLAHHLQDGRPMRRDQAFLRLMLPVLRRIQQRLARGTELTFSDMIRVATWELQQLPDHGAKRRGGTKAPMTIQHLLLDEAQDLTGAQWTFLLELARTTGASLFAVGDDAQSIYGFQGADGDTLQRIRADPKWAILPIQANRRNPQNLVDAAERFVADAVWLGRPEIQSRVAGLADIQVHQVERTSYRGGKGQESALPGYFRTLVTTHQLAKDVLILARTNRQVKEIEAALDSASTQLADAQIRVRTYHGAKGLEAEQVILTALYEGPAGLPWKRDEDQLLAPVRRVRSRQEVLLEERRLFYVAITRAKRQLILAYEGDHPSPFIRDAFPQGATCRIPHPNHLFESGEDLILQFSAAIPLTPQDRAQGFKARVRAETMAGQSIQVAFDRGFQGDSIRPRVWYILRGYGIRDHQGAWLAHATTTCKLDRFDLSHARTVAASLDSPDRNG